MSGAYISNWAYMPLTLLGPRLEMVRRNLTVTPRQFRDDQPVKPVQMYDTSVPAHLGVPINWALDTFPHVEFEDRTVEGEECYHNRLPDPTHPRAAPGQAEFIENLLRAASNQFTVLGKAATGTGKTVSSLSVAAQLGRRTLIEVHMERLARQWADEIHAHLGIPYDDIGWVQGDICNYDHPFVIAISQSLSLRRYPKAFYTSIGTHIRDEVHRVGAPLFNGTLGQFPAKHKISLTATDHRKDGCDKVFKYYWGPPSVVSSQVAEPCKVHVLKHKSRVPKWMKMSGSIVERLSEDHDRNKLIVKVAKTLWDNGRQSLFIGDRVEHLQNLIKMCGEAGIPYSAMGLFVNQRYSGRSRASYKKLKAAARGDKVTYWGPTDKESEPLYERGTTLRVIEALSRGYLKVALVAAGANRTDTVHVDELRQLPEQVPVMDKVGHDELDRIKANARMVFATYGMLKEGIDIPRLDSGADVTPRADGDQVLGRVRRRLAGRPPYAIWYTIKDEGHPTLEGWFRARVRDYQRSKAQVITS